MRVAARFLPRIFNQQIFFLPTYSVCYKTFSCQFTLFTHHPHLITLIVNSKQNPYDYHQHHHSAIRVKLFYGFALTRYNSVGSTSRTGRSSQEGKKRPASWLLHANTNSSRSSIPSRIWSRIVTSTAMILELRCRLWTTPTSPWFP